MFFLRCGDCREQAADDARGARFGALGLVAFAVVVFVGANSNAPLTLTAAMFAWTVTACGSWWLRYGRRS